MEKYYFLLGVEREGFEIRAKDGKRKAKWRVYLMELDKAICLLTEEYEKAKKLEYVSNPLAFALYRVWKKADTERPENRER
ncbi:MAG: hypothetical protein IJO09_08110 [Oscillospiraceae bacterium]|nr:hypothetical protein [Oscillospiraceae bacterium]